MLLLPFPQRILEPGSVNTLSVFAEETRFRPLYLRVVDDSSQGLDLLSIKCGDREVRPMSNGKIDPLPFFVFDELTERTEWDWWPRELVVSKETPLTISVANMLAARRVFRAVVYCVPAE